MSDGVLNLLLLFPVFLFSLCIHEFAHAWTADRLGDPTPRHLGRLSIHPMAHADWVGTLLLPAMCLYYGMPFFGWAKPVPVQIQNLRRGRADMALVAFAGPFSNIILALVATIGLGFFTWFSSRADVYVGTSLAVSELNEILQVFAIIGIRVNLMLAVFNLLPFPPLDGYMIVQNFLPVRWAIRLYRMTPWVAMGLLAVFILGGLRFLSVPVSVVSHWLIGLATGT